MSDHTASHRMTSHSITLQYTHTHTHSHCTVQYEYSVVVVLVTPKALCLELHGLAKAILALLHLVAQAAVLAHHGPRGHGVQGHVLQRVAQRARAAIAHGQATLHLHSHTHTHTHMHTHTHIGQMRSLEQCFTTHTHAHTHTHSLTHPHAHTHTHAHTLTHLDDRHFLDALLSVTEPPRVTLHTHTQIHICKC